MRNHNNIVSIYSFQRKRKEKTKEGEQKKTSRSWINWNVQLLNYSFRIETKTQNKTNKGELRRKMEASKLFIFLLCIQITAVLLACCIGDRDVVGWLKNEVGTQSSGQTRTIFSIGLWQECTKWEQTIRGNVQRCVTCQDVKVTPNLKAVRALIIIAIICGATSIIIAGMVLKTVRIKASLISAALFVCAIFNAIAMSIFSVKENQEELLVGRADMAYDWAFVMGWFTAVESTVVGVGVLVWSLRTGWWYNYST